MAASQADMHKVVATYLQQVGIASVTGALQNFWVAKLADRSYQYRRTPQAKHDRQRQLSSVFDNYASPNATQDALITYETEHVNVGAEQRFIAYVTLPGGACFGSPESKRTGTEARSSAGLVALYNSLANEHPYRIVTQTFAAKSLAVASKHPIGGSRESVDTYKLVLEHNLGRSMLELQEFMCAFRLLSWAGVIDRLRAAGFSQERLISEYADCVLDDAFRSNLCLAWMSRLERDKEGSIKLYSEFLKCEAELHDARHRIAELRFEKEKRDIIRLAYSQFNQDMMASQRMLYAANFAVV